MPNAFTDPLFSVRRTDGAIVRLSWLGVIAAAENGSLAELPRVQAHQRSRIVLDLAIWLHLMRRHAESPVTEAASLAALEREGLVLAGALVAPVDRPAFYQAPVAPDAKGKWNPKPLTLVDSLFTGVGHEAKGAPPSVGEAEDWVYALVSGGQKIFVKDNPDSVRWGVVLVTPLDGRGGLGFEIRALADAYDRLTRGGVEAETGHSWASPRGLADHVLWLHRWPLDPAAPSLGPDRIAWPFVDVARPVRLRADGDGFGAVQIPTMRRLADKVLGAGLADPGVARSTDGRPFRLVMRRPDYKFLHATLFGRNDVRPAPIALAPPVGTRALRVAGIGFETGKTRGAVDLVVRVPERLPARLGALGPRRTADAVGDASACAVEMIGAISGKALRPALRLLFQPRKEERRGRLDDRMLVQHRIAAVLRRFEDGAALRSIEAVLEGIAADQPAASLGEMLEKVLAPLAGAAFDEAVREELSARGGADLAAARARLDFVFRLNHALGREPGSPDMSDPIPPLARTCWHVADTLAARLARDPELPKVLRTMDTTAPPLAFWSLLADPAVPQDWAETGALTPVFLAWVEAIARVPCRRGAASLGRSLAEGRYSEARLARLLEARGLVLLGAFEEIRHVLAARGVSALAWHDGLTLLVADTLADEEALRWVRRRIALDALRQSRKSAKPTAKSAA